MQALIALSRAIDWLNGHIGRWVAWLVVAAAVISAGNAVIRKLFDTSSNAWLEAQWLLFGMVFLLAAPWTLSVNEHIRIDVVSTRLPLSVRNAIEIIGHVFFLLPIAAVVVYLSWPFFVTSWLQNEQSLNAGGLPQWPAKLLIPLGFALLFVQGISELIKRIAIIAGYDLKNGSRNGGADVVRVGEKPRAPTVSRG